MAGYGTFTKWLPALNLAAFRGRPEIIGTQSVEKVRVLFEAIQRVDGELSHREKNVAATPSQAELSRHAFELKMSSQTSEHPDPGRSASEGMHPKKRKELFKVGTTRKEIGRVWQAGKVAQVRKDSKG